MKANSISTRNEVLEVLKMSNEEYEESIKPVAREVYANGRNEIISNAMLGHSNVCRNQCLYCGMRAENKIERYRITVKDVKKSIDLASELSQKRIFFVSGEDPKYGLQNVIEFIKYAKSKDFHVSLGIGELEKHEFEELKNAGLDEYVLKFEMADEDVFNRLNPSTNFKKRMKTIEIIKDLGFELASGNIIDYPHQTLEQLADEIMLMKELEISWAPVIPYMPAKNTPLALEGGFGRLELLYKEISLLRLMMPKVNITAQQPGENLAEGLSSISGNLAAISAGANMLFLDLLPNAVAKNFSVIDNRSSISLDKIKEVAKLAKMEIAYK